MNIVLDQQRRTSIKSRFLFFAVILFSVILIGGSVAFALTMWQIFQNNAGSELEQAMELEKAKLETSVNSEIAIALKMATSPLIQRHFVNPADWDLKIIAFDEIVGYRQAFKS
jgi:methyl-accepting chemotaxis protein